MAAPTKGAKGAGVEIRLGGGQGKEEDSTDEETDKGRCGLYSGCEVMETLDSSSTRHGG